MSRIIDYYENNMPSCFYQKYLGVECPGCGFQRSLVYLLKGDLLLSLKTFPALIPILIMLGFLFLHLIFKYKKGHLILLYLFIFNSIIITVNYIYKILT
ncbi:MAG: DUF2752 domain-containing protein [Bacteroidales bacterium]|nr:DUF2752 domain-containing protein [Bacteroidales bacterium]